MKLHVFARTLAGCGIALGAIATLSQPSYAQVQDFFCGMSNGKPATIFLTSRGNNPMILWIDTSLPSPWTPHQRCQEISTRFQRFHDNGTLKYIKAGWFNGQPVLCVAGYKGGPCLPNGLLVILKRGTDPHLTLQRLLDRRALAAGYMVYESDDEIDEELISEVNGEVYFNIERSILEAF